MKTILCDVDEVCADLIDEWVYRYNCHWNDSLDKDSITGWAISDFVRPECGKKVYDILQEPDLYDFVRPVAGALEGVRALRKMGHRVVFVSSCVAGSTDAKIEWLFRHKFLPREKTPRDFIAAKDKALVRGDLLIDDGVHNVESYPGPTILFDAPHNRDHRHSLRAHGWGAVEQFVKILFN